MEHCFYLYVFKGRTYDSLTTTSGVSAKTLERYVNQRLTTVPPDQILPLPDPSTRVYLLIDGLWFGKLFVLLLYRIAGEPFIIHATIAKREWGYQVEKDLRSILAKGYVITGVVSDGGKGISTAVDTVLHTIPHQICLAHVHREATRGVGKRPRDWRIKELKKLVDHLFLIESREALRWWMREVNYWLQANKEYLQEHTHDSTHHRWWYTHSKTRKTVRILLSAPKHSFKFLDGHRLMPRTTNEIEGLNSAISSKWLIHRGLQKEKWPSFLRWYIYFRNRYFMSLEEQRKA